MNTTSTIPVLPFTISPEILWVVFGFFAIVVTLMTIILLYHWSKYGYNGFYIGFATTAYIIGAVILSGSTFISLTAYIQSL